MLRTRPLTATHHLQFCSTPFLLLCLSLATSGCGALLRAEKDSGGTKKGSFPAEPKAPGGAGSPNSIEPGGENGNQETREPIDTEARLLRLFDSKIPTGTELTMEQLRNLVFDGSADLRCRNNFESAAYTDLIDDLGGVRWAHEHTQVYRDLELPLFGTNFKRAGGLEHALPEMATASVAADGAAPTEAAPTISRADKVGRHGDRVIYLSARYGLFFVDVSNTDKPHVSCSVLVPGRTQNFYLHNNRLILLTEHAQQWRHKKSAVIAFDIKPEGLNYAFHHILENQSLLDSRLFNNTLAIYSRSSEPQPEPLPAVDARAAATTAVAEPAVSAAARPDTAVAGPAIAHPSPSQDSLLTVIKIEESGFKKLFEELLIDNTQRDLRSQDITAADVGTVFSERTSPLSFLSASDRYLLVGRQVTRQRIVAVETRSSSWQSCETWNPRYKKIEREICQPSWSFVENPDYDPQFRCPVDDQFSTCVDENKNRFSKGIWTLGEVSCQTSTYWRGMCERYRWVTNEWQYPVLQQEHNTELAVYRFGDDTFARIDNPEEGGERFSIPGRALEHKSFSFQGGYLYATMQDFSFESATARAIPSTSVRSYKVEEDALIEAGSLSNIAPNEDLKSVLFEDDMLYFVTFRRVDPLFAVRLSTPGLPQLVGELKVPGFSSQLIAHENKLIGIGRDQVPNASTPWNSWRPKVSVYDVSDPSALFELSTNIFATDVSSAWSQADSDDQVYHFAATDDTLFLPLAVSDWNAPEKLCQSRSVHTGRVAISNFSTNPPTTAEVTLDARIDRVHSPKAGSALAFGDSLVAALRAGEQGWSAQSLHRSPRTVGIYRIPGSDQIVAIQSIEVAGNTAALELALGTKGGLEGGEVLARARLPIELIQCYGMPRVRFFGKQVVFLFDSYASQGGENFHSTYEWGFRFGEASIEALSAEEAKALAQRPVSWCAVPFPFAEVGSAADLIARYSAQSFICKQLPPEEVSSWQTYGCNQHGLCNRW